MQSFQLRKSLTIFQGLTDFEIICESNFFYLATQSYPHPTMKFDRYLNKSNTSSLDSKNIIILDNGNTKEIYISHEHGINRLNSSLDRVLTVSNNTLFGGIRGIWYNNTADEIHLFTQDHNKVYLFNRDLNYTGYYNITCKSTYVTEQSGIIYAAAANPYGRIMMIKDKTVINEFPTPDIVIRLLFDNYGILAILCPNNMTYLYYPNGTYTGKSWTSPIDGSTNFGFDPFGNFIFSNATGMYFF